MIQHILKQPRNIFLKPSMDEPIRRKTSELQILKYNIYHTNVFIVQDTILIVKVPIESAKKKNLLLIYLMQKLRGYIMQQIYC